MDKLAGQGVSVTMGKDKAVQVCVLFTRRAYQAGEIAQGTYWALLYADSVVYVFFAQSA